MCSPDNIGRVRLSMAPWVVSILTALEGQTTERS